MPTKSYTGLKAIVITKLRNIAGGEDIADSTTTATTAGKVEDSNATFITSQVQIGDLVQNVTDSTTALVTAIDSETVLSVDNDVFESGETYNIGAQVFANVYGVRETEANGFPSAWVVENTGSGQIIDTHRNERDWQFDVILHVKVGKKTPEQAYEVLLDAVDKVITSFDTDPLLLDSNNMAQCKWVRVIPVDFNSGVQDTPFQEAILSVAIVDIVNRF